MNKERYEASAKGAFIGWVGIIVMTIVILLSSCYGTYYISDAEYSDLREEHAVTTFHDNQIYWGFQSGYYYYYGKPHFYPWYYYYNTCPPSFYNTTTHIIVKRPVKTSTHRPNRPIVNRPRGNDNTRIYVKPNRNHNINTNKSNVRVKTKTTTRTKRPR